MIVVSDTSPLNYLVLIEQVQVLPVLFGRVIVPPAVMGELQHAGAPDIVRAWAASPPPWLEIRSPATMEPLLGVGTGEAQAIRLAQELRADAVLIGERQAATPPLGRATTLQGSPAKDALDWCACQRCYRRVRGWTASAGPAANN